jgi:photosystem II stability/assembly factor-like uncharacterized protein
MVFKGEEMPEIEFRWGLHPTNIPTRLFGVDVVDPDVVFAAGDLQDGDGAVVRTTDGGGFWRKVTPPGGSGLRFHDVHAFDADQVVVMSAGRASASEIFRSEDGGLNWQSPFVNQDQRAFDGIAFFDSSRGLAFGDPVGGRFRIFTTTDGGRTWTETPTEMPKASGEFARATGTSLVTFGPNDAWFGTAPSAAQPNSRVFHSRDGGHSWQAATVPIPGNPEFGVASLAFRDRLNGMAVGGSGLNLDSTVPSVAAVTSDGGESWTRVGSLSGFRTGVAWVPAITDDTWVAVGSTDTVGGSDFTTDGGQTWHKFDDTRLIGINCLLGKRQGSSSGPDPLLAKGIVCWAVGADGVAAKLSITRG